MVETVTPSEHAVWVAAGPIAPRTLALWHSTLLSSAPIVPTLCGSTIEKPELRHQLEPPAGQICPVCSNVIDQVARLAPEDVPYVWLTTVKWEIEWAGQRIRQDREDAIQAFADAALEEREEVRLLADGAEYQHFWIGERGEPHHTIARLDGSKVETTHDAALANLRQYTQWRQVPFKRDN